ncbi:hypothetical protein GYA28_00885 [Candidatus Roizmanbacteria bacterium]|nr:hypothetical protein [Candidatus Roizmanbacteria bacterium]
MVKIKWILAMGLLVLLLYTRLVNLGWGLPYALHPDERNMANAVTGLGCSVKDLFPQGIKDCLNPRFFAYGQLPLYLSYFLVRLFHILSKKTVPYISFEEATFSLRLISSAASIFTAFFLIKTIRLFMSKTVKNSYAGNIFAGLIIIFSPYAIQYSHFGTTESLLMFFYTTIIYLSILFIKKSVDIDFFLTVSAITCGLALATKMSAMIFFALPVLVIFHGQKEKTRAARFLRWMVAVVRMLLLALPVAVIFSPHNYISLTDFLMSMRYESDVALGRIAVFYTRQFVGSLPILFQAVKIFPYALGVPTFAAFVMGFLLLPKKPELNLLRLAWLIYFFPSAFVFTKWTRFMAPVFPLMATISIIFILGIYDRFKTNLFVFFILTIMMIVPGIAYLSVYQNPDVRFTASEWIYKNIPGNTFILSESEVIGLPIPVDKTAVGKTFQVDYFDFYALDDNPFYKERLDDNIKKAEYIVIPSRRVFANHPANAYPLTAAYYRDLFSGKLGFKEVARFDSFPRVMFFGKKLLEINDEWAEETWSVFDHPVVRIYKRT